jgi:hypothetical protein
LQKQKARNFKKTFNAFLKLSQEQKDYYDMKKGFSRPSLPKEHHDLFKHIQSPVLRDLKSGFGENIGHHFKSDRDLINEDAMRMICRDDPDEIIRILDSIEALL